MNKEMLKRKLNSQNGESLAETLIALLISVLGIALLAMMIQSSSNLIRTSKERIRKYTVDENAINDRSASGEIHEANLRYVSRGSGEGGEEVVSFGDPCDLLNGVSSVNVRTYKMTFGKTDIYTFEKE